MTISKAIQYALEYHRNNCKKNTVRSCEMVFTRFESQFKDRELGSITPDEVLSFLTSLTDGRKQSTKRSRYAALSAFFSLIQNALDPQLQNPCKTSMLKKLFRPAKAPNWKILEKETVDEVIFRMSKPRNRIILELIARSLPETPIFGGCRKMFRCKASDILRNETYLSVRRSDEEGG
jgi:hypothetical protein